MKLGEIKLQALMLIFPDIALEYREENTEELIYNLRSSGAYGSYLSSSVGAINRAFSSIEQKRLSGKACLALNIKDGVRQGEYISFDLSPYSEILCVSEIYLEGISVDFNTVADSVISVKCNKQTGALQLVYYRRLTRINHTTSNNYEIALGSIAEAIPYLVKADLLSGENDSEATAARSIYEGMMEEYASKNAEATCFQTVYSLGRI